jgi:hypothetical protein
MNTKKVLIMSEDKDIMGIVRVSALTLTKLNCQISVVEEHSSNGVLTNSVSPDLNLIIIDSDKDYSEAVSLIKEVRTQEGSAKKKILLIHSGEIDKDPFFKAGCDSIMKKDEFKRVVNNILVM